MDFTISVYWYFEKISSWQYSIIRQWRRSYVFIVNFEQISHIVLVFPLLTLNK